MSGGRLFQRRQPATGNVPSPTVDSRVCRITSCEDDDRKTAVVGTGHRIVIGTVDSLEFTAKEDEDLHLPEATVIIEVQLYTLRLM